MKIGLVGYGRMGRAIESVARARGHEVVVRLTSADRAPDGSLDPDRLRAAEVALEFTHPGAVVGNIEQLASIGLDLVVGTTGWYDRMGDVQRAVESAGTGLVYAPNFSVGTQLFLRLVQAAARLCRDLEDYDPYVFESHHRHKRDHPSGTARRVAEMLIGELDRKTGWAEGPGDGPADPEILQVVAVRAGEIPGTHLVGLEGPDGAIELRHEARGRSGFARGAVMAAEWIRGRTGLHTFEEMLSGVFGWEV